MGDGRGRGKAGRCEDRGRNVKVAWSTTPPQSVKVAYEVQNEDMASRTRSYRQSSCISQSQSLEIEIVQRGKRARAGRSAINGESSAKVHVASRLSVELSRACEFTVSHTITARSLVYAGHCLICNNAYQTDNHPGLQKVCLLVLRL
jgi:hypothetical protein